MRALTFCLLAAFLLFSGQNILAQFNPGKIIKKKVEQKSTDLLNKKTGQAFDSVFNNNNNGNNNNSNANQQNKNVANNNNANNVDKKDTATKPGETATLETYSKFDFIPGEKVIFFDDFSQDAVGDFPALWNTNGSGEVVTTNLFPGKWLQFKPKSYSAIWTDKLLKLPENYTIEFDVVPTQGEGKGMAGYTFRMIQSINEKAWDPGAVPGKAGFGYSVEYYGTHRYRTYLQGNYFGEENQNLGLSGSNDDEKQKLNQKYHISIWVQKTRLRLYQDQNKIFDIPRAFPLPGIKMDRLRFESGAAMVSNVRIAIGAPDMRNKLMTEGKIVSYGIYFDVNKDVVKPESYGSLKEIANILTENADVKIKIVGHTDADGADEANLDLSKRRAASVKNELVKTFGIDASRMQTDGMGETKPVAANDTPANKALNRRVEFIKVN